MKLSEVAEHSHPSDCDHMEQYAHHVTRAEQGTRA
jgi:hypothetical protein